MNTLVRLSVVLLCFGVVMVVETGRRYSSKAGLQNRLLPSTIVLDQTGPEIASGKHRVTNRLGRSISGIKVVPSCGCTSATVDRTHLAHGESLTLTVSVEGERARKSFSVPIILEYSHFDQTISDLCYLAAKDSGVGE